MNTNNKALLAALKYLIEISKIKLIAEDIAREENFQYQYNPSLTLPTTYLYCFSRFVNQKPSLEASIFLRFRHRRPRWCRSSVNGPERVEADHSAHRR